MIKVSFHRDVYTRKEMKQERKEERKGKLEMTYPAVYIQVTMRISVHCPNMEKVSGRITPSPPVKN